MSVPHDFTWALEAFFRGVWQASWQGSLAIGLVLLARRAFGTRVPARWHYLMWFLVLARLLVPSGVLPHTRTSLENLWAVAHPPGRPAAAFAVPKNPLIETGKIASFPPASTPGFSALQPKVLTETARVDQPRSWWTWAARGWLVGVGLFGGWLVICHFNLRRRLRRETQPVEAQVLSLWQACCQRWLRRSAPRLLAADWVSSPALVGWWRPTLLVPREALDAFSGEDWEHVFAHEIAHLRWRDHWSQVFMLAAWCVHWFNPVVWIGFRRLRADRELAADEWVLKHLASERALAYGETLFKTVAKRSAYRSFQPGMVGISEDGAQMKQRLQRIAAFLPRKRMVGSLAGLGVVVVLASVVLGQSAVEPAASPAKKAEEVPVSAASPKPEAKPAETPAVLSTQQLADEAQRFHADVLAAARSGDGKRLDTLMESSWKPFGKFSQPAAVQMLDDTLRDQDLTAFVTLYDAVKKTLYGKDWKIRDERLAALVKAGRTDFLDALLVRGLDLARLTAQVSVADATTAGWITRRVAEAGKQRADVEALGHAARDNDLPTLRRLLDAGVDVNAVDDEDNTALIEAVFQNRLEAARLLLERGALVDKVRLPGWDYTPLCLVTSVDMAQLLKDHGANVHATLFGRKTSILIYVAMWQNVDVVTWFLRQGLDPKMIGDNDENLLFGVGDAKTAKMLMDLGVDPNRVNEFGRPPISQVRSTAVAQALIDGGAKITGFKQPLLPQMIQLGGGDAIEAVFKAGAEHDPAMLQKLLIQAAHSDNAEAAKVLLRYGAKPNETGLFTEDNPLFPLQASTIWGGEKVAKVLLDAGADPNGGKNGPGSFLRNAMSNGYKEVAKLLRAAGARGVSDLSFALAIHDQEKVKALLATAPTFAENPAFWEGVLVSAAQAGDLDVLRMALAKGVPIEANPGITYKQDPYQAAAEEGQDEALAILLATRKPDADPNELRWAMWEAVWNGYPYANQRSAEHFERCVQMLLDAKAPVTGYDKLSEKGLPDLMSTAVFSRNPGGNPTVMEMLARAGVEPNPTITLQDKSKTRLLDAVQKACTDGHCSAPVAETLIKLTQLFPSRGEVKSNAAPEPTPAPAAGEPKMVPPAKTAEAAAPPPRDLADFANLDGNKRDAIWEAARTATKAGDIGTIEDFLNRGLDVNTALIQDCTLLFIAADDNQPAIVKLLLAHGANVLAKTSWGDVPLQRACWRGYKEVADTLIQAGAPVNELWYDTGMGDTAALEARDKRQPITDKEARDDLFFAVASGHPNTFGFLWKKLAPMTDADKDKLLADLYKNAGTWGHANLLPMLEALGATPAKDGSEALVNAVCWNFPDTVKVLLDSGVSPNVSPPHWGNMLRDSAGDGKLEVVRLLLEHGAEVNVQDPQGFTPLAWAAYCGHEDICLLLLDHGADGGIKDHDGRNAAWHAAGGPHCPEALERMIKQGVSVKDLDSRGETILNYIMTFAQPELGSDFFMTVYSAAEVQQFNKREARIVENLLAAGMDINSQADSVTALMNALERGHYAAARTLVVHGADASLKDKNGNTALVYMITYPKKGPLDLELVQALLKGGGDPNPVDHYAGTTPPIQTMLVEEAISTASLPTVDQTSMRKVVELFLDNGATFPGVPDVKAQDALQAAAHGNLAEIQKAVKQGVPISAKDADGWDALAIVTALDYDDSANWLIDHGANVNGQGELPWYCPLWFAVERGDTNLVEKLLARGAKVGEALNGLYTAVLQNNARMFDVLLRAGADPTKTDGVTMSVGGKSFTPPDAVTLFLCIKNGQTDMAKRLLDKGANPDPANLRENRGLVYYAVEYDRPEILQALLDHGANPSLPDDKGEMPLDLARKSHPELVSMLIKAAGRK